VFTREEFFETHRRATGASPAASRSILEYHLAQRHLHALRRGVYMVSERTFFNPWAAASKLAPDATLAWLGAATFHRLLFLERSVQVLTAHRFAPVRYGHVELAAVHAARPREERGVEPISVGAHLIHTTTRARTLVDLLDRPELCLDRTELARAFHRAGTLDTRAMLHRARTLGNSTTCARLGVALELLRQGEPATLDELWRQRPTRPAYFCRSTRGHDTHWFLQRWNLVVPRAFHLGLEGKPLVQ
jgi:predicted transcriptional regulator of viral defense system